jgi:Zn-dependent metalloprotease
MSPVAARPLLAALVLAFAVAPSSAGGAAGAAEQRAVGARSAAARLAASHGATVTFRPATGVARRVTAGEEVDLSPRAGGSPGAKALAFLGARPELFGIRSAGEELGVVAERTDRLGLGYVVLRQFYRGIPVFGAELRAQTDRAGRLTGVGGVFVPGIEVEVRPRRGPAEAAAVARRFASAALARPGQIVFSGSPELVVYVPGLERGRLGEPWLAWKVEVSDGGSVHALVFVDDRRGKVGDHLTLVADAMERRAFSGVDQAPFNGVPDSWPDAPDWVEGDPFPTALPELDGALAATADVYRFFAFLGMDSYDDAGHVMDVSWNHATFCPNASWNGFIAAFCSGFGVHDVVVHEWAHAWTRSTHGLIYRWQSGALNESYSDLWGELLDRATRLPVQRDVDGPDTLRAEGACSAFREARLRISSPAPLAGDHDVEQAAFGPAPLPDAPTRRLVLARDGAGADVNDACEPLTNAAVLAGNLAFAHRGACEYQLQARHAQQAGAIGLVVGNTASSPDPGVAPRMGCDPVFACDQDLTIPTVSVPLATADALRGALDGYVGAAIRTGFNEGAEESVRWLLGEDVRPGGPARDMWTPTCYGDPGKVSDPQYHCATSDSGGVHVNSGIPNHAFALLVDGGTYNGRTIGRLGRTKAAHVYWRAQIAHQVPASDFADHADALEAACGELRGLDLPDPFGGAPVRITAADCAEVATAMAAVEMRAPVPCDFEPILDPGAPPVCDTAGSYPLMWSSFETGDDSWTTGRRDVADPATFDPRDWTRVAQLPDGRAGTAFFAPDPLNGYCVTGQSVDDESGVLVLESRTVTLPSAVPVRLAFEHWIATETTWDGGNVKLKAGDGPWQLLPESAYRWNAPADALRDDGQNTNPMAGERAWHGTDEGSNAGSWGRTIVDLSGLVAPGEPFRLRFEFGTDVCFGTALGWYVDDVRIFACTGANPLFLDGFEAGSASRWSIVED